MPARALSSATISFGLVSIPVKVYTATSSKTVHFSMLHATDKGRLRQQYICRACEQPVERNQTVRGFEYARDQYVVMEEEELKGLERKSDKTVDIEEFIPIEQVDPVYFDGANLLGPDKGGAKAYQLLREAMLESGRVAIGRFHTRGRDQLVLIRPTAGGLVLHGLFYADEVRSFEDVDLGDRAEIREQELVLANQLIDQLTRERFDSGRYEDGYRVSLLQAIERKVAGEEVVAPPAEAPREKIIDLVAALKQSLAERSQEAGDAERKTARAKAPAKKPSRKSAAK
jgi:DNA end-binding protein Ku